MITITIRQRVWALAATTVLMAAVPFSALAQAQVADLRIVKTGPVSVLPNERFSWTLDIVNAGPSSADGASFSDPIPYPVGNIAASCGPTNGVICGAITVLPATAQYAGTVTGTIAKLPAGGSVTINIDATAPPPNIPTLVPIIPPLVNVATVLPPSGVVDINMGDNHSQSTTRLVQADLVVSKTHSGTFRQGQVGATYTLVVTNIGAWAHNSFIFVNDTLPAGLTATSMTGGGLWSCTVTPLQCIYNVPIPLAPGASLPPITLTVDVAPNAPSSLVNLAHVDGVQNSVTDNDDSLDPTAISPTAPIPSLSILGLVALSIALAASVAFLLRQRT